MSLPAATKKQRLAFRYALKHPYSIIAMDPRLGKTRVGIGLQKRTKLNCLVIAPAHLVPNWAKEIQKWAPADTQITKFMKGSEIYEPCDSDFVIVSYKLVQKAEHLFDWADMLLIDEGHYLKSMATKQTQFIHRCIFEYSIKRVHILTGTILKNRVQEFYSPLAITFYNPSTPDGQFLNNYPSEIDFADRFAYRREFKVDVVTKRGKKFKMNVAKWEGLRNLNELKTILKGRYIRIKADKDDLPPLQIVPIQVSDRPNKALRAAFDAYFTADGASSVKPEAKKEAAMQTVPFTIEYIKDLLLEVGCALVYSDHVPVIEAIAAHFKVPAITGKMPSKKRAELAKAFQAGNGSLLCCTIGALKEGQDLFRAKDLVLNDPAWVPGDLRQVYDRMRGLGEKDPRTVHQIHGSPQSAYIFDVLDKKAAVIEAATS